MRNLGKLRSANKTTDTTIQQFFKKVGHDTC